MPRCAARSKPGRRGRAAARRPPVKLCTDNAAMIGWAGAERFATGQSDPLDLPARPRWPLDDSAAPVRGAGVKA
jgi:N6-L-threonylcarbamoyladenine synthase